MRWKQEDAGRHLSSQDGDRRKRRRGDETRGRGRMGWIRMLTGERMRREQENAGATSASRMPAGGEKTGVEGGGRGDGGRIGEAERRSCSALLPYTHMH
uniref:Uncharacterized protein n=1 Tax=Oryza rufipogon TaxID=4529 RepID=A0A0E0Q4H7_ORYRU